MTLPKYEASFRVIYRKYRTNAKKRNLIFELTPEYFRQECEKPCVYCGSQPNNDSPYHDKFNGSWLYNGLDRIDNSKGYVEDNVQPCCTICNRIKSNMEEGEFIAHIRKIAFLSYWLKPIKDDEL